MSMVKNLIQKRTDEKNSGDMETLLSDAALRHDIKASLRDLKMLCTLIQDGYKFDDDMAKEHVKGMSKALSTLDDFFGKYFTSK